MQPHKQKPAAQVDSPQINLLARGATINLLGAGARTSLLFVYTVFLARILPVDQLGEYFLMFAIINVLAMIATAGLDYGVVRYVSLFFGEKKLGLVRKTTLVGLAMGLSVGTVMALGLFLAAPWISQRFFGGSALAHNGLQIFAISIPLWVAARVFNATTQGLHKMEYQVYSRDLGEQLSKLGFSVLAVVMGAGLIGIVWANVASMVVAMAMSVAFALMIIPKDPGPKAVDVKAGKLLLFYSLPLAFTTIVAILQQNVDMFFLGYLGTSEEVGFYGAAIRVGLVSAAILTAFGTMFAPIISDTYNRKKISELAGMFKTVTRWIFLVTLPLFLVVALFPGFVLKIFGGEFAEARGALVILAVAQLIHAGTGLAGMMVMMSGRPKMEFANVAVGLMANTAVCLIMIPRFGILGAAVANMVSAGVVNALRAIEVWLFMRVHAYDRRSLKPLLAGASAAAVILAANILLPFEPGLLLNGLLVTVLLASYIGVIAALGLDENDKMALRLIKARLLKPSAA
ncbi:MAG: flippase [Thermoleophilia bacterium]|nr:flippase [Thermoleophilia bacterium]